MPAVDHWKPRTRLREVVTEEARDQQEWPVLRRMIVRVLEPFPEAKEAFLEGLRELRITEETKMVQPEWEKDVNLSG